MSFIDSTAGCALEDDYFMKPSRPGSVRPWQMGVLIPACNEEELLPRCLKSVLAACRALPAQVSATIVVAVDNSIDRTEAIAGAMLGRDDLVIRCAAGVVGHARACAANAALQRFHKPPSQCWLANTDADCVVPSDWLLEQWHLAQEGAEAIAGIVDVDHFAEHDACVKQRFRDTYRVEPDGSHPHVHGANLGMRADAYIYAGGWHNLATAEDHDLWQRLGAAGARQVSTDRLRVLTSGRRKGRAPHGFAEALALHNESAA